MRLRFRICILSVHLLICVLTAGQAQTTGDNPKADRKAVVVSGQARFTILTPRLVRLEWSPDSIFEDRASLVFLRRNLPVPNINLSETDDQLTIMTDDIIIRYKKNRGKFTRDNLSIRAVVGSAMINWSPGQTDSLNLRGTTRTLDGTNGEKDVQLEPGLISRSGWSLVDDSDRPLFDSTEWHWVVPRPPGERQDWYLFCYGEDYKKALADFTLVAGKIPIPPKFAFGYWWSRYWTYSDAELRSLIADMRKYDVPIDVLIIDMDWHETYGLSVHGTQRDPFGQSVGWTGYTWNKTLFPDPGRFLRWTKDEHLKTALNLHPASGIAPMEEQYPAFAKEYGFDTSGGKYIPFAIEDKKWARTWFDVILHPLERQGIDFWWLDWQAWLENRKIAGLSNTWWLNYVFFTDMERQGGKRPLLFHRWGGLGNHRYQIGFSGDSWSTWDALAYQPAFTATAANVAYGYWSHDIGGHLGNDPDPELYLRWIQWGIFSPILRTHSTKSSEIERRIWKYPEQFNAMREAFRLRYALVPYIYSAARKAYETGVAICHPLYYEYPKRNEAYSFRGEYFFGDDMIVAPVTSKADPVNGLASKSIWLPPGDWYEWFSGTTLKGNVTVERKYTVDEIPLFVKAGAVVPLYPKVSNLQQPIDTLILFCVPGRNGGAELYDDDGATSAYREHAAWTSVSQENPGGGRKIITIAPRRGSYQGMPSKRAYEIRIPNSFPPLDVTVNGKKFRAGVKDSPGRWSYDANELTTRVYLPLLPCDKKTEVVVTFADTGGSGESLLNGMSGLFRRIPRIVGLMKDEVNRHDQIANAPSQILRLGSLPTRIAYSPGSAAEILSDFQQHSQEVVAQIMNYPSRNQNVLESVVALFPFAPAITPKPDVKLEKEISDAPVKVEISVPDHVVVHYTTDGTEPTENSAVYQQSFQLDSTTTVKAKAFKPGSLCSFTVRADYKRVYAKSVTYKYPGSPRYTGGGEFALVDGSLGTADNYRDGWVGFQQSDMVATIELVHPTAVGAITTRFLQNQESWIFLPAGLKYEVSTDGVNYKTVYEKDLKSEAAAQAGEIAVKSYTAPVGADRITHLRITAFNIRTCPPWHEGNGGKAWLFTDEIILQK